jgi:fructuronate reductase
MASRLDLGTLRLLDPAHRPAVDPTALTTGIVHLGIGAFHRAHQAVYTDAAAAASGATEWGICGVSQRSPAVLNILEPQDGLYSVLAKERDSAALQVVGSVREVVFAGKDPYQVVERLAAPQTRVISLTITEKGYHANLATGRLDPDDEIRSDAAGRPPRTAVGQLVAGLRRRRTEDSGPVTILPCDNIPANGRTLQRVVEDFCELLPGDEAAAIGEWISTNVSFPSTMVDRIVPASNEETLAEVERRLGLRDEAALLTETFTQWVVEDRFLAGRPAWEHAGVTFADDVTPFELMKLRLVNASNSALAYLGLLTDLPHIADAVEVPRFALLADRLMREEMAPTIETPPGVDLDGYCTQVLTRFANPWLLHRTRQVAMDGSQKLPQRILRPIAEHRAAGREPLLATLVIAAWIEYVRRCAGGGYPWQLEDPMADELSGIVAGAGSSYGRLVSDLLGVRRIFGEDLPQDEWFRRELTRLVTDLAAGDTVGSVGAVVGS